MIRESPKLLIPPTEGLVVITAQELSLPSGRPDVVVASVDLPRWIARRDAGIRPVTSPQQLQVAQAIRKTRGALNTDQIAKRSRLNEQQVGRALRELQAAGWVESSGGKYTAGQLSAPSIPFAAAVEIKTGHWRWAAKQAMGWSHSFDFTWLAFPSSYMRQVPRRNTFFDRFGLIAVQVEGDCAFVRRSRTVRADPLKRRAVEEAMFRRWLDRESGR